MDTTDETQLTCKVVRVGDSFPIKEGLLSASGICTETTGAKGLSMQLITVPPLARAKPHMHEGHETAIYIVSGTTRLRYGDRLSQELLIQAGEFLYIPASMPHTPYNPSESEPCVAIVARTDPWGQESVHLLPELE